MLNETSNLLTKLESFENKEEIIIYVNKIHLEIKNKLFKQGVIFHKEENFHRPIDLNNGLPQNINEVDFQFYNEVNFIRQGINSNWVDITTERERYDEIQIRTDNLFVKLK